MAYSHRDSPGILLHHSYKIHAQNRSHVLIRCPIFHSLKYQGPKLRLTEAWQFVTKRIVVWKHSLTATESWIPGPPFLGTISHWSVYQFLSHHLAAKAHSLPFWTASWSACVAVTGRERDSVGCSRKQVYYSLLPNSYTPTPTERNVGCCNSSRQCHPITLSFKNRLKFNN